MNSEVSVLVGYCLSRTTSANCLWLIASKLDKEIDAGASSIHPFRFAKYNCWRLGPVLMIIFSECPENRSTRFSSSVLYCMSVRNLKSCCWFSMASATRRMKAVFLIPLFLIYIYYRMENRGSFRKISSNHARLALTPVMWNFQRRIRYSVQSD